MNTLFEPRSELRIGKILEVNGSSLRIELDNKISELTRSIDGRVYPIGQIASIIKIHFGRKLIFAYVRMLRMRSDLLAEEGKTSIEPGDDSRILEADLFGQGSWSNKTEMLSFSRGVETYPLPLQDAYLCLNEELESIYRGAEDQTISPMIPIGHYIGSNNAVCRANIDKLFGHHCAILGSTGSGKSGTVASIIHSVLDYQINDKSLNPRIIMIDPHGEYAAAFIDKAIVYKAYHEASSSNGDAQELKLPYWLMSGDELRSLIIGKTEDEATSQNNIVYEALTYARMLQAGIVEDIGNGLSCDTELTPKADKSNNDLLCFDRDKPLPFKLSDFINHINNVQGNKEQGGSGTGKLTPFPPSDKKRISLNSVLNKLRILRSNPQLNFIMDELNDNPPTLERVLSQFVGENKKQDQDQHLRIIDISGLPNEVAGPLTALIARLLFQYKLWQTKEDRRTDPILFVCEEAHRYVPNHGEAQYKEAQEAVRRIAKEGRKYGIGLMLVSQRPSDVESTVLSQCNSWLILRLTNSNDQQHVAKFLPDSLAGLTSMLSALTRREALFVGEAAALPSRIRITKLPKDKLPDSHDISFVEGWTNQPAKIEKLKEITDKWTGSSDSSSDKS